MPPIPSESKNWVIYKITSPSGRVYVGVTSNFQQRLKWYKRKKIKYQRLLKRSLEKYGFDNHTIEILETFESYANYAHGKEMFWIRSFMSNNCKWPEMGGLNLTDGGEGTIGFRMTEEQKKNLSEKITGFRHSEETKRKIGEASRGNKYRLGCKMTAEQIEHRSSLLRGRKLPRELVDRRIKKFIENNGRRIEQYSLDGKFISEFPAISVAAKSIGIPRLGIQRALSGMHYQSRGFIFKYK